MSKTELTVKKLSPAVQRLWRQKREDWCFARQTLRVAGPGSNQRPTAPSLPPPPPPSTAAHSYSVLIDEPFFVFQPCTFLNLKSPFILGKRQQREKKIRHKIFFFPCWSVAQEHSKHFSVSSRLIVFSLSLCLAVFACPDYNWSRKTKHWFASMF